MRKERYDVIRPNLALAFECRLGLMLQFRLLTHDSAYRTLEALPTNAYGPLRYTGRSFPNTNNTTFHRYQPRSRRLC